MKKVFLLIITLLSSIYLLGTDVTYTFTSKSWEATPFNWVSGLDGNQLTSGQGIQVTTTYSGANGTSDVSFQNISKVSIKYCTNSKKGNGAIKVQVGNGTEQTFSVSAPSSGGTTLKDAIFNFSPNESGKVKITAICTTNSVYIYSCTITYSDAPACALTATITPIPAENGSFNLSETSVCGDGEGGTVTVTDIEPADGYEIDLIVCTNSSFSPVGTVNQSTKTISGIKENCYVSIFFKEKIVPTIDVVEWNPDYIKLDIEDFDAAKVILEDQNTQVDAKQNYADSLFFSKYFEAASNVKLLGIYNGTNHTIDISSYGIGVDDNDNGFSIKLFSQFVYRDVNNYENTLSLTAEEMQLGPNEEIILISYQKNNAADSAIIKCAKENEKSGFARYYRLRTPELKFNGDDAIALVNPDGNFIDLIGAGTKADGRNITHVETTSTNTGTYKGFMDNPGGWYNEDGINIETNDSNYALSTNRCLLIRKKYVKSGLNAVSKNTTDFVTLGGTYGEWRGLQIPGTTDGGVGTGVTNACNGFNLIGSYDYSDYYVDYTILKPETTIEASIVDGFYQVNIPQLDTLSCTNLKIIVKEKGTGIELEDTVKIPIMIKSSTTTADNTYFNKKDCNECDVVVLKDITLTTAGTKTNRDLKLYQGAELIVGSGTTYNINSLAFRRDNDTVSSLFMNGGTLNITENIYFDLIITPDKWHYISLPGSFSFSNLIFRNGKFATLNVDYLARHYDGQYRATNLRNGWKTVSRDSIFTSGQGFIFGLSDDYKKKEFRFTFSKSILAQEFVNKTILNLHAWGNESDVAPNHKGWNLIGNPFMSYFNAEMFDKIRIDSLVETLDSHGNWTGGWELSGTSRGRSCRYAVIPSDDAEDASAGGYKSVMLGDLKLSPFTCFFVLLGGFNENTAQGIEFKNNRRANKIPAKSSQDEEETFLRIKVDNWKTGFFISNHFTDEYEPGDDLESFYPIYQSINGYKLLYSAINDSIIETGIKVLAPKGILSLEGKTQKEKFEYIFAKVGDSWYNLLLEDCEVNGEFLLTAKRKQNIATDIEIIPVNGLYKFTDGKSLYINRNNKIYNIIGFLVK